MSEQKVRVIHIVLIRLNVVRPVCDSLVGKHHTVRHRMITGVIIMVIGVAIAKVVGHSPYAMLAGIGDGVGYALHGLGLMPFAEHLSEKFNEARET